VGSIREAKARFLPHLGLEKLKLKQQELYKILILEIKISFKFVDLCVSVTA
jgi:hypothetical protein